MACKRKYPLREKIRIAIGVFLILAFFTEVFGIAGEYGLGINGRVHLAFAVLSIAGALAVFCNVRYASHVVLPVALGIFFYEVYQTASVYVSIYTVASGLSFFVSALLCFLLIRAHKV